MSATLEARRLSLLRPPYGYPLAITLLVALAAAGCCPRVDAPVVATAPIGASDEGGPNSRVVASRESAFHRRDLCARAARRAKRERQYRKAAGIYADCLVGITTANLREVDVVGAMVVDLWAELKTHDPHALDRMSMIRRDVERTVVDSIIKGTTPNQLLTYLAMNQALDDDVRSYDTYAALKRAGAPAAQLQLLWVRLLDWCSETGRHEAIVLNWPVAEGYVDGTVRALEMLRKSPAYSAGDPTTDDLTANVASNTDKLMQAAVLHGDLAQTRAAGDLVVRVDHSFPRILRLVRDVARKGGRAKAEEILSVAASRLSEGQMREARRTIENVVNRSRPPEDPTHGGRNGRPAPR